MEPSAQGQIISEPTPQPATPVPAPPPVVQPIKQPRRWPFVILGMIAAFILGIGFNKYNVASYISKIQLPKFTVKTTPKPTPSPAEALAKEGAPTASPTAGWKTFTSTDLSFQYPPDWTITGNLIATKSPTIRLNIVPKNSTLMNECMQQVGAMTQADYIVKKFIRVTTGEACATGDANPREIWVVPSEKAYAPGISFSYSATEATRAGQLFTTLLNTFKFVSSTPSASTQYSCPESGYVDCMPVLDAAKQAACTPEAMAWYNLNCPNFKGGAL